MTGTFARIAAPVFVLFATAMPAIAHGVAGARFFPATLATEDPFAADELALPTVSYFRSVDDGVPTAETGYSMEYSKTLWRGIALSFEGGYVHASPQGAPSESGFDNLAITPVFEIAHDDASEFAASVSLTWEIGGSGSKAIAESASAFEPAIHFGKGFGSLPDSMALLRPFALTGNIGYAIEGHGAGPHVLKWSGALEYSLSYLQTNVRDAGIGPVLSRVTPVVEFAFSSPLGGGKTTGTINPGLLWSGQEIQLGMEAIVPVNAASGSNIGVIAQLHFYMDDIFPHSLGTPLFGDTP